MVKEASRGGRAFSAVKLAPVFAFPGDKTMKVRMLAVALAIGALAGCGEEKPAVTANSLQSDVRRPTGNSWRTTRLKEGRDPAPELATPAIVTA
jgi:hypothetical protein